MCYTNRSAVTSGQDQGPANPDLLTQDDACFAQGGAVILLKEAESLLLER